MGWHWCFRICAILNGTLLLLVILFVPETTFNRNANAVTLPTTEVDEPTECIVAETTVMHLEHEHHEESGIPVAAKRIEFEKSFLRGAQNQVPVQASYFSSLRLYSDRRNSASTLKVFARPFILIWHPAVFAVLSIYGVMTTWEVIFGIVNGMIFVAPPYNFTVAQTGLVYISPFCFQSYWRGHGWPSERCYLLVSDAEE